MKKQQGLPVAVAKGVTRTDERTHVVTIRLTSEQIAALTVRDNQALYKSTRPVVIEAVDAYTYLKHLAELDCEHLVVLTLTTRNRVIARHIISSGTLDAAIVHPRDVFRVAIQDNAAKIIVAHNHPSGDATPSDDDILVTKRLATAGKILGIALIDHVIIGEDGYYSLQQHGQMSSL
jgi:DNA repair protein RadC